LLTSRGVEFDTVHYLADPPSSELLTDLVERLVDDPAELVRHDARFKELGLDPDDYRMPAQVVALLSEHIELLQRPLIDDGTEVVIARPPSKAEAWLDARGH
jgi:arsenate reductase